MSQKVKIATDEHLRLIAIALRMVSTAASVHIGGGDFTSTSPMGANKPIEDIEASLLAATKSALDELVWWPTRRWRRRPLKLHSDATRIGAKHRVVIRRRRLAG